MQSLNVLLVMAAIRLDNDVTLNKIEKSMADIRLDNDGTPNNIEKSLFSSLMEKI